MFVLSEANKLTNLALPSLISRIMFAFGLSHVMSCHVSGSRRYIVFIWLNLIAVVKVIVFNFFESFQLQIEKGEKKRRKSEKSILVGNRYGMFVSLATEQFLV